MRTDKEREAITPELLDSWRRGHEDGSDVARLVDEVRELRKDQRRKEWLVENEAFVLREEGHNAGKYFVAFVATRPPGGYFDMPDEAIDAAMKEGDHADKQ